MDTAFSILVQGTPNADTELCEQEIANLIEKMSQCLDCHSEDSMISHLNAAKYCSDTMGYLVSCTSKTLALEAEYGNSVQISSRPLTKLWNIGSADATIPSVSEINEAIRKIDDSKIALKGTDISIPQNMELDLGAVAKGYALDEFVNIFQNHSISYSVVDAASAVLLYGQKPENTPFRVAISDPNGNGFIGTLLLKNAFAQDALFVSTSGDAERFSVIEGKKYSHIFDLQTGFPSESDLAAVTVVAKNGLLADYLSTLIYLGGSAKISTYLHKDSYQVLAIDRDGVCYQSDSLTFEVEK